MATPTLISVSNVALPNAADSGNVAVTIPSGANACVIGGTYYVSDSSVITSITGSVFSSTTNGALRVNNSSGGSYMGTFAAAFKVTATGSQTVRVQKTGSYSEGPTCQIGWFTVDDADNFVRTGGFVVVQQSAVPQALSATVNSNSTDYVFGLFGTDGSSADPSAPTGTTLRGTMQTTQFDKSIAFSANTVGASTTNVVAGSRDYPTLSLIALTAGGGGSTTHAATGALVGPGSTIAGTAARTRAHPSSGALTGPGAVIVGSARHNVPHASSGVLTGLGSAVVGSASRTVIHGSSGDLVGPGSTLAGAAARTRQHPSSGDLVGPGSTVAGTADRTRAHASSGVLTGPGSVVDGAAARTRQHASSGALMGPGSVIVGSADHQGAAGTHDATGALVGPGSTLAGSAARKRTFASSGALVGPGAIVNGSAARVAGPVSHASSGALVGPGSVVAGAAARANPAVSHNATGVLVGPGSRVNGQAQLGDSVIIDTHDGFWVREWKKMVEREKKLTIQDVIEIVEESPQDVLEALPEVKKEVKKEFGKVNYQKIANNLQMQEFIAKRILIQLEIRKMELEEDDLEVLLLM